MTYRDERLILREKLGELDLERAALQGRVSGLVVAIAEADERTAEARRRLAALPWRKRIRKGGVLLVTGLLVAMAGGICIGAIVLLETCTTIERSLAGVDRATGERCTLTVHEVEAGSCRVTARCASGAHYSGTGRCREIGNEQLEYWDHDTTDGSPALVISEREHSAAVRDEEGVLQISLDGARD